MPNEKQHVEGRGETGGGTSALCITPPVLSCKMLQDQAFSLERCDGERGELLCRAGSPPWGFVLVGERRDQTLGGGRGRASSRSDPVEDEYQQLWCGCCPMLGCCVGGGGGARASCSIGLLRHGRCGRRARRAKKHILCIGKAGKKITWKSHPFSISTPRCVTVKGILVAGDLSLPDTVWIDLGDFRDFFLVVVVVVFLVLFRVVVFFWYLQLEQQLDEYFLSKL